MSKKDQRRCLDLIDDNSSCEKNISLYRKYCALLKGHYTISIICTPITFYGSGKAYRVENLGSDKWLLSVNMWLPTDSIKYYTALAFATIYLSQEKKITTVQSGSDPELVSYTNEIEHFLTI